MPSVRRLAIAGAVVAALVAYAAADAYDAVPGVLTLSHTAPAASARPTPSAPVTDDADPVLPELSPEAPAPSAAGVAARLTPLLQAPALGSDVSAVVIDAASGDRLLSRRAEQGRVPASTAKLLTAAAVLSTVGPQARLVTRVVQGASPDEIVLVGGGDTLLGTGTSRLDETVGHAGLATLAAQVAQALQADGRRQVAVRFDDSLFAGANTSPRWATGDVLNGYTGRVSALGLGRDRARVGRPSPADPSAAATASFVTALRRQGITVPGTPVRSRALADTAELGRVESAPVGEIMALALTTSDNALAEVMARLTARQLGRATTFEDAALAVLEQVQRLGIDTGATQLVDGSGLGRGSVVPPRVLADVLSLAASDDHPELRPLLVGVACVGVHRHARRPLHQGADARRGRTRAGQDGHAHRGHLSGRDHRGRRRPAAGLRPDGRQRASGRNPGRARRRRPDRRGPRRLRLPLTASEPLSSVARSPGVRAPGGTRTHHESRRTEATDRMAR